jgi:hypothetical protein
MTALRQPSSLLGILTPRNGSLTVQLPGESEAPFSEISANCRLPSFAAFPVDAVR